MARVMGGKRKHRHCVEVETVVRTQYVPVYTPVYAPVVRPLLVLPLDGATADGADRA
jgi:hypothetical protein